MLDLQKPYKMGFVIGHYDPTVKIRVAKFHRLEDENNETLVSENNSSVPDALHDRRHDGLPDNSLRGGA